MASPPRLVPLLQQFDFARDRLAGRMISADDATLDTVGHSTYPYGSDADEPFIDIVWWVNQDLLHHGAEIALLRDLYRARGDSLRA